MKEINNNSLSFKEFKERFPKTHLAVCSIEAIIEKNLGDFPMTLFFPWRIAFKPHGIKDLAWNMKLPLFHKVIKIIERDLPSDPPFFVSKISSSEEGEQKEKEQLDQIGKFTFNGILINWFICASVLEFMQHLDRAGRIENLIFYSTPIDSSLEGTPIDKIIRMSSCTNFMRLWAIVVNSAEPSSVFIFLIADGKVPLPIQSRPDDLEITRSKTFLSIGLFSTSARIEVKDLKRGRPSRDQEKVVLGFVEETKKAFLDSLEADLPPWVWPRGKGKISFEHGFIQGGSKWLREILVIEGGNAAASRPHRFLIRLADSSQYAKRFNTRQSFVRETLHLQKLVLEFSKTVNRKIDGVIECFFKSKKLKKNEREQWSEYLNLKHLTSDCFSQEGDSMVINAARENRIPIQKFSSLGEDLGIQNPLRKCNHLIVLVDVDNKGMKSPHFQEDNYDKVQEELLKFKNNFFVPVLPEIPPTETFEHLCEEMAKHEKAVFISNESDTIFPS